MTGVWRMVGWKRLAVSGLCLATWRALEQIPVAGLNPSVIDQLLQQSDGRTILHAIGTGLPLARYSIVAMGIWPYIVALVVMSLIPVMSERVRTMRESPEGRLRLRRWTAAVAVVLACGSAYGWTVLMQSQPTPPALEPMDWFTRLAIIIQLTGGTMVLVLLADTLDEFGLGFGNGAVLIYALSPVAGEVHRLAYLFASTPSVEALYRPFAVWVAFSIALVVATVAVTRAARRVPGVEDGDGTPTKPVDLKLLLSGILRPTIFASGVLFLPVVVGNYYAESNPGLTRWIYDVATPYGPNPWTDFAYLVVNASLVIAFAYFVVAIDFGRTTLSRVLVAHIYRLTLIGGVFLAVTVVVVPVLNRLATHAAGTVIGLNGFDAVLVAAMVVAIVGAIERSRKRGTGVHVLASRLP
jgi:preprotein translocase subunit SecY